MRPTHLSKDEEARLEKAVEQLMAEYNGDVVQVIKAAANGERVSAAQTGADRHCLPPHSENQSRRCAAAQGGMKPDPDDRQRDLFA